MTSGTLRSRRATAKVTACPRLPESAILSRTENVPFPPNGKILAVFKQRLSKIGQEVSGGGANCLLLPPACSSDSCT